VSAVGHDAVLDGSEESWVLEQPDRPGPQAPESFDEFYVREYPHVLGLAFLLSGSRWAAEDLAQDAFLAAHREWDRIGRYDQPAAWVRRVIANKAVSATRRRVAEGKALMRWFSQDRPQTPDIGASDPTFWSAVRSLPKRQAQVIALYYLEDLSIAEIADILDVAPGTVKRHLFRGRASLAGKLSDTKDDR
jgi:RNA polymerase sigma-70 factor (ECF subfamily)